MTFTRAMRALLPLTMAATLAGCANDQSLFGSDMLTTSSITPSAKVAPAPAPRVDPACVALQAKIDALRQDGVAERVAKVATGKSKTVSVKRESLAKITELDGANAEFQAKCSTIQPQQARAPSAPTPSAKLPAAQSSAALPSAALPSNVSIVANPNAPAVAAATAPQAAKLARSVAPPPQTTH